MSLRKQYAEEEDEIERYHEQWYGKREIVLTEEDIDLLRQGYTILVNDGEYSTEIRLQEE